MAQYAGTQRDGRGLALSVNGDEQMAVMLEHALLFSRRAFGSGVSGTTAGVKFARQPGVHQMSVIAVAGLPGSGKSRLMNELQTNGFKRYNDINRNWDGNIPNAKNDIRQGENVAISDIMFCDAGWRQRLERELGAPVEWIFLQTTHGNALRIASSGLCLRSLTDRLKGRSRAFRLSP